jgi:hypothetical protein
VKPEAALQRLILDWLAANRIWFERRNTGAMVSSYGGKKRLTKFSQPGTADIMATRRSYWAEEKTPIVPATCQVIWIEVKAPKGKQSETQKLFQQEVEAAGHVYVLAYSLEDVIEALP